MRKLLGAMVLGALLGCGGEDESLVTNTNVAALEKPLPDLEKEQSEPRVWVQVFDIELMRWKLLQLPVEERFFYEVNPTTPPAQPAPPCPMCR